MWLSIRKICVGLLLAMVMQVTLAQADVQKQLNMINQEVVELYSAGKYMQALVQAEKALAMAEGALGAENPATVTSLNNLARLHEAMGEYQQALSLYQRGLAIAEKAQGPEHPATITFLSNLAGLHKSMGAFQQALSFYKRALEIAEKAQGPEHPSTGTLLNNLAGLYVSMGVYQRALPLYKRALQISEKAQGPEHPSTGTLLNNLAALYDSMGAYQQSLPLYKRALEIAEKAQGPEHPSTGTLLNNLAALYDSMGAYQQSLPLYKRALEISEKAQGPEHPNTGARLNNLARLYESMGAYQQALPLYKRALEIAEKAQGSEHPDTGTLLNNLAGLYRAMDEYQKALPLYKRALQIAEKVQGLEHPITGTRLNNLAGLYRAMGEYDKALALYQRALMIAVKVEGPEHPSTGGSLNNLAALYRAMDEHDKALPLYQRALANSEKTLGPEHPNTGVALINLADLYQAKGAYEQALPLNTRALAIAEKALGPMHPSTITRLNGLATLYELMNLYEIALPLFVRALAISEKALGPEHPETGISLSKLAGLYRRMGEDKKALPLYQQSFAIALGRSATNPELLASTAENLCSQKQNINRGEAIFYCKLAVNTRQTQRRAGKNLPSGLQQSFAKSTEDVYLLLNRLLKQSHREFEASQVLLALKEVEFTEFVSGKPIRKSQIDLTQPEASLTTLLRDAAEKLQGLKAKQESSRNVSDQVALAKLELRIAIAKGHLYETFEQIPVLLKSSDEKNQVQFNIDNNILVKHLAYLNAATPSEKNAIIVIAASKERTQISTFYERESLQLDLPIAKDKLSRLVAAMRAGIVARSDAWRGPARELYALLIAPVEAQLAANRFTPQNLSFVLSGETLEILPLAALLDTNSQFLVSKYRLGLYNPSAGFDTLQVWKNNWDIAAFGTSMGVPSELLAPSPQVAQELANIVRSGNTPLGILPGEKYLDSHFTRHTWGQNISNNASSKKRRVLHVATHFKLASSASQSSMLMGDGSFYSVAELAAEPGLPLSHVDLVTLSLCEGKSLERLAALFQYKGANAVLGTLWGASDSSTAELMRIFYTNRGEQRKMSKAQALQEAQKAMLASDKWSHPYYWAGFLLMGNWL